MLRLIGPVLLAVTTVFATSLSAATFMVTTTADSGAGSFDQAIIDANATPGVDNIHFNIGGGGPQIITTGAIPVITDTVIIDGTSQPGYTGTPIVTLDGNDAIGAELRIQSSSPSTIRGLVIIDMLGAGVRVENGGAIITSNYIGVNGSGVVGAGNGDGIEVAPTVDGVVITNNVISANSGTGIQLDGRVGVGASDNNVVQGNIIGLDAQGVSDLANGINGVVIHGGDNNLIGGTAVGTRNVIGGNTCYGIRISSLPGIVNDFAISNTVQGNLIGTNAAGTSAVRNGCNGIVVFAARQTTIGGVTPGAGNLISGNGGSGVSLEPVYQPPTLLRAEETVIAGNFIGTDISGTTALGNGGASGVFLLGADRSTVGGTTAGAGNLISGNVFSGINTRAFAFDALTTNTVITNNLIGTDKTGSTALPNGSYGIVIDGTTDSTIGGSAPLSGNVISGNYAAGINFRGASGAPTVNNFVQGNRIGTDTTGTVAVPNGGAGIEFVGTLFDTYVTANTVGGMSPWEGNTIRFNGGAGIVVETGVGNRILGNSIDRNTEIGIDLGGGGVTLNDQGDGDSGPNNQQNYPDLTTVIVTGSTAVTGTFNSTPARMFRIELFNSPAADPSGFGEGRTFLGFADVTTDAAGNATLATTLPPIAAGSVVTATATDVITQDTSEFSDAVAAVFVAPTLFVGDVTVTETQNGTANAVFTVTISHMSAANVTFQFTTADGTAMAPDDYVATTGMGVIIAGATSTTITVPVRGDTAVEPDETFLLNITNVNGATSGDEQGQATIVNDDALPIPTLSEWMLILASACLAIAGAIATRGRVS